jgi:hypothetical protein
MRLAASFLGGAKSRLLPPSVPFRFFAAAVAFHVFMWPALLVGADEAMRFRGGFSSTLAALHLLTLGVLTTTSIGASVQLLPVATRRPLAAVWPIKVVFWLVVPGTILLTGAMYVARIEWLVPSAVVTAAGLLLYCGLLADNLRRARTLPLVAAYGWVALVSLVIVVGLGVALALNYQITILNEHGRLALAHLILGGFGFMGLLAIGFSHVLVPMFSLAAAPAGMPAFAAFALAVLALVAGAAGALIGSTMTLTVAGTFGLLAAVLHVRLMQQTLKAGMRKRLGLSFILIRAAWVMLPTTMIVGLAALHGLAGQNGPTLFGFLLFWGWLLTFLMGILQRILPFLASMHVDRTTGGAMPAMSEFAGAPALYVHAVCHAAAIVLIAFATTSEHIWMMRAGAAAGLAGALAFSWFAFGVTRRIAFTPR